MQISRETFQRRFPNLHEKVFVELLPPLHDRLLTPILRKRVGRMLREPEPELFHKIEIETINRCNNTCSFCPVNTHDDPRPFQRMSEELFVSIVRQLGELGFSGRLALHSNNEPMMDRRIVDFARIAREHVPRALLYLYTNGTLLKLERFESLMRHLDRIVIDNYDDGLEMIPTVRAIHDRCQNDPALSARVTILMKLKNTTRKTRGGSAPNRDELAAAMKSPCLRPFSEMIVRPDGKLSLCCSDPLGAMTMGDLTKQTIVEAWRSDAYRSVRESLARGREEIELCRGCDELTFGTHLGTVEKNGNRKNMVGLLATVVGRDAESARAPRAGQRNGAPAERRRLPLV